MAKRKGRTDPPPEPIMEAGPPAPVSPVVVAPAAEVPAGDRLRCPACGCPHLPVLYTRHRGTRIIRRRECRHCGRLMTTTEHATG